MLNHVFRSVPVVLLFPFLSAAQVPKVPEKVDKALRARVTDFFQYHVDGQYRKAMELVADETQDEYFGAGKMRLQSFKIDNIKYDDKFNKAVVTCTVVRDWEIRLQHNSVTIPMTTTWKIEHGKWVWYHEKQGEWLTPMGPSDYNAIKPNPDGTVTLPKINQDTVLAAARNILAGTANGVDKLDIRFTPGQSGSDKVSFHNGVQGPVGLEMVGADPVPGLTYKFDKLNVNAGENSILTVEYAPQDTPPPAEAPIRFTVNPFNVTYTVMVHFPPAESK